MEKELITVTDDGYNLIRTKLLGNILGEDKEQILYWAGKQLARDIELASFDATVAFFKQVSWGNLYLYKQSDEKMIVVLEGDHVTSRLKSKDADYALEAGFLAQQIEKQNGKVTEATAETIPRKSLVQFVVIWDKKDSALPAE